LFLVVTDESLQKISAADLDKLSNLPGNVEVKFSFHTGANQDLEVSLQSIQAEFDVQQNKISKKIEMQIENMNARVKGVEDDIIKMHSNLFKTKSNSYKRQTKKHIDNAEKRQKRYLSLIEEMYKKIDEKKEITLDKVTGDDGESVALNTYY
jgi:septal ring factor EnvC (AmiA/AmiB activator)